VNPPATKRALVLAGGASFGAFQAGVIQELASRGVKWDVIYGTSVGAINGAYLAQGPRDAVDARSDELCKFWQNIRTSDIYKISYRKILESARFWKALSPAPGIFDTTPLSNLVYRTIGPKPLIPIRIFTTPALGGPIVVADETKDDIRPWVIASSSIPIIFPPISINGVLYMDGGVRQNNPISYSMKSGVVDVDVVLCFPSIGLLKKTENVSLLTVAYKTLRAAADQFLEGEALALKTAHPNHVRIYRPDVLFPASPLDFNPGTTNKMIEMGRRVVRNCPIF